MQNKIKLSKSQISLIVCAVLVPLFISIFACYLVFGNIPEAISKMWELRGKPNKTASAVTSLSYVLTILVAVYALLATTFFSFLVWKVSTGSLQVSQQLKDLENNRDKEIVRENALIVYYDLQRGISNLRNLYISCLLKGSSPKPNRIYFSEDWIKNVANLRGQLTSQELNKVYKLYEQFYTLQSLLEEFKSNEKNDDLNHFLEDLSTELFADFIQTPLLEELKVSSVDELVDIDLYIILQKIYYLTFTDSQINDVEMQENGEKIYVVYLNGVPFFKGNIKGTFIGDGSLYNKDGKIKCSGQFKSKQFIKGTVYGYYSSKDKCYEITYEVSSGIREIKKGIVNKLIKDDNNQYFYNGEFQGGKVFNGITTLFHKNKKISYQGEIKDGYKDGQGTFYNEQGQKVFEGIRKEYVRYKGISFVNGREVFNGEYKDSKPWNGITNGYNLSEEVKSFSGMIRDGQPVNGTGMIFKVNNYGEDFVAQQERRWHEEIDITDDQINELDDARHEFLNAKLREEYFLWTDYITADWCEGIVTKREDIEGNISVYVMGIKKNANK
ncbi:hypothetical protein [Bacillus paranthracis]|uniref:hypothetical protein n=1 Tax=Bacillus paranthracis TaxID=2026186 RepID=UPI0028479AEA|nr:hypothetical protein [Bacillus paranthracis]MDR4167154.1 hypothetical protein [Bacillus paranthracis]